MELLVELVGEGAAVPHLCEAAARYPTFPSVLVSEGAQSWLTAF